MNEPASESQARMAFARRAAGAKMTVSDLKAVAKFPAPQSLCGGGRERGPDCGLALKEPGQTCGLPKSHGGICTSKQHFAAIATTLHEWADRVGFAL